MGLLLISTARKVWDFDILRGIAPSRLDEISSERYKKKREFSVHSPAKFESGAM